MKYNRPEMEILELEITDVITTSGNGLTDGDEGASDLHPFPGTNELTEKSSILD